MSKELKNSRIKIIISTTMILSPLFLVIAKAETAMSISFATLLYAYGASIAGDIYQRRWLFLPIICGLISILYLVSKSNN